MAKTWPLEDAEHLAELLEKAARGEVQVITKEGERAVVLMDYARYLTLSEPKSLLAVVRGEPPYDDLQLERDGSLGRTTELK